MKTKVFLLVVTCIYFTKAAWGQQIDSNDISYLSKVSLKQHVSEESFMFNYPTGYEETVNKKQGTWNKKRERLYQKGLETLSNPKKALRYFEKGVKKYGDRDASYQVGHYYCFGIFDKTGTISRKGLKPINAKKGLSYLNFATPNKLCKLFADKDSWMFDPRRAVYSGIITNLNHPIYSMCSEPSGEKYNQRMVEFVIKEYAGNYFFDLERIFADNFEIVTNRKSIFYGDSEWILYRIPQLAFLRDSIIGNKKMEHTEGDIAEYMEYLGSKYLLIGFDCLNDKDDIRALYNFAVAGYAGNADGFRMTLNMITNRWAKRFPNRETYDEALDASRALHTILKGINIPKHSKFYPEYEALLDEAKTNSDMAYQRWWDNLIAENEEKKEKRARFWNNFAQAVAVGTAAVAQGMALAAQQHNYVPRYVPTATMNTGFSTDYYTSPAYLNLVQTRANQSMANYQDQLQRIGQQALANNQQMLNRSKNMFGEMISWSLGFQRENGREPTDLEKSEWVKRNYPDMYASYVQAQAAQYEQKSDSENSEEKDIKKNVPVSNTYDCSYCGGSGRLLQEEEVLNFGLTAEKEYKCNECGKWKYKGKTHRHYDCPHCKGKGKVTFN